MVSSNQLAITSGILTFFLFGFLTLVALVYLQHRVPETKNRSLQAIEQDLLKAQTPKTATKPV
ncbi:MAG: hypothetical protein ACP5P1_11420 [Acidimicrobiales bacterium]